MGCGRNKYKIMCAYGPTYWAITIDVDLRLSNSLKMNCVTLPGEVMVEFAELLTNLTRTGLSLRKTRRRNLVLGYDCKVLYGQEKDYFR